MQGIVRSKRIFPQHFLGAFARNQPCSLDDYLVDVNARAEACRGVHRWPVLRACLHKRRCWN